eukprot:jgi/Galph1/1150/GphlegSOOS_G5823.1
MECSYHVVLVSEQTESQAEDAAKELASSLFEHVNNSVYQVYQCEAEIEIELKRIESAVRECNQQLERWKVALKPLQDSLKELGDIENWTSELEEELNKVLSKSSE